MTKLRTQQKRSIERRHRKPGEKMVPVKKKPKIMSDPEEELILFMKRKLDVDLFKKIMKAKEEVEKDIMKEQQVKKNTIQCDNNNFFIRKISLMSTKGHKAPPRQKGKHNK